MMENQQGRRLRRGRGFFEQSGVSGSTHRAFIKSMDHDIESMGRPVIGICSTCSELINITGPVGEPRMPEAANHLDNAFAAGTAGCSQPGATGTQL